MSTFTAMGARTSACLVVPLALLVALLSFAASDHAQAPTSFASADGPGVQGAGALAAHEYDASQLEDGVQASNPAQNFRTYFREDGIALVRQASDSPSRAFTWRTDSWGRESERSAPGTATMHHAGTRVEYRYEDGLVEWYENGPDGLEQGFMIPHRPSGSGGLVVVGRIPENLYAEVSASGRDILLSDGERKPAIRYAELHVIDAAGREVPSQLTAAQGAIEILIDDRGASYPLTVDPLMTTPAWTAESNLPNFRLGEVVASAGDVNGDTFDDVFCGSHIYRKALLWYGSASGLGPNGTPDNADWSASDSEGDSYFGYPLASAGDVNGDGYGDVIVGAYASDIPIEDCGRACVWYGSASGLGPNGTPENADWRASGTENSHLGADVASAGDVNGDGYDDVIISAISYSNGQTFEGGAFVWYGSASGLGPDGTLENADWSAESDQALAGSRYQVGSAGDVNGDGYGDIFMGLSEYDVGILQDAGIVMVWYGSASGLGPNGTPANAHWRASTDQENTGFGEAESVSAGDFNGDNYSDIIVGAWGYHIGQNSGAAFLWNGSASGLGDANGTPANADWKAEGQGGFGHAVASVDDVEGDGFSSVIIATYCSSAIQCVGRAMGWFGSASGLGPNGTHNNADWSVFYSSPMFLTLASAGRVNGDPFDDVIVACPDSSNGEGDGIIFVYHGIGSAAALEPSSANAAAELRLAAIRPNPFSLATQIEYVLPQAGRVQLRIYDAAGRQVTTLVDKWTEGQQQVAAWNGRDEMGAPVPAGAYFVRLEANDKVRTTKLILTR